MKKILIVSAVSFSGFLLFSLTASAQSAANATQGMTTLASLINVFTTTIVKALGTLFLSAGVVAFLFGIVQYVWGLRSGDATKTKTGNQFIIWGLVGLFVMFSVYGIIVAAQKIFNIDGSASITIPDIKLKTGTATTPTGNNNGGGLPTGVYTCPDGVTTYNTPSGSSICPVYTCPNGLKYYNLSDSRFCNSSPSTPAATASARSQYITSCTAGGFKDPTTCAAQYDAVNPTSCTTTDANGNIVACP